MDDVQGCGLTDDEVRVHRENHRKIAVWLGASRSVSATCGGIAAALDELLAWREAARQKESQCRDGGLRRESR